MGTQANRATILHAEDQEIVGDAVELVLGDAGFVVERAANGAEALKKVLSDPKRYDLILTDDNMPVLSGLELVRELRAINYPGRIVILSGVINAEKERLYREMGIRTIVEKPFQVSDLLRSIEAELADR